MKTVSVQMMCELDRRSMEEQGLSGEVLMDRAGRGVAEEVMQLVALAPPVGRPRRVRMAAGIGNNGGDALVAARYLAEAGLQVDVWLAGRADALQGEALIHFQRMQQAGVDWVEKPEAGDWPTALGAWETVDIWVDGLLGTGGGGPLREPVASAARLLAHEVSRSQIVAIDIPSGLDADSGEPGEIIIPADLTVTLGRPKTGLLTPAALDVVGHLAVVDIGLPEPSDEGLDEAANAVEMVTRCEVQALLPRRSRDTHKGSYGHVLLIGGAQGYTGAITMACRAAVHAGAGQVSVLTPRRLASAVAASVPEVMVYEGEETPTGSLTAANWEAWAGQIDAFDAVLVGPGLTLGDEALSLVRQLLREVSCPIVLDADAVSVLAGQPHWVDRAQAPVIMTPHPGELATLFGQDVAEVQADRTGMAHAAASYTESVVVLKGAGTVIAAPGQSLTINMTGNPGMSVGGSGDVLAGIITALVGQGLAPHDAARVGVYVHGLAGDVAAWKGSQLGLVPTQLIHELPAAFRRVCTR